MESWISNQEWKKLVQDPLDAQVTDTITWTSLVAVLKACGGVGALKRGQVLHAEISKRGLLEKDVIANAAISMYSKWDRISGKNSTKLRTRDINSCDVVSPADFQEGDKQCFGKGLKLPCENYGDGKAPLDSYITLIEEYGKLKKAVELNVGDEIADVIDRYTKSGCLSKVQEVVDKLPVRSALTWTALTGGYVEQSCDKEELKLMGSMKDNNVLVSSIILVCGLQGCGSIGSLDSSQNLHIKLTKEGFDSGYLVESSLASGLSYRVPMGRTKEGTTEVLGSTSITPTTATESTSAAMVTVSG
ncbi:hypothetical protein L7F22_064774 [Adiantum nelumboides]|nr:hypothetical protein [Adiantum nelumboides]